jgi:hypothetical protein
MQITLTGTSNSNYLYTSVPGYTSVKAIVKSVHSLKLSATVFGSLKMRFLNGTTVVKSQSFNMSETPTDFTSIYSGGTSITRIDVQIVSNNSSGRVLVAWVDGPLEVYSLEQDSTNDKLYWQGYVDASTLSRTFIMDSYNISVNAVCGLLDLKNFDYPSSGITSFRKQSEIIKEALNQTGLALNIRSQLNTTTNGATGNTLSRVYANTKRFVKNDSNGKTTYMSCYDALTNVLRTYNAKLFQSNGYWQIVKTDELNSPEHTFTWSNLSVSSSGHTRVIDVASRKLLAGSDELTKVSPLKTLSITFRNKNLPDNVLTNGTFENTAHWTNANYPNSFYSASAIDGQFRLVVTAPPLASDPNTNHYVFTDTFSLTFASGATLHVEADVFLANVQWSGNTSSQSNPYMKVSLMRGSTVIGSDVGYLNSGYQHYSHQFAITQTHSDYYLRFEELPYGGSVNYTLIDIRLDNVNAYMTYSQNTTFDKFYVATNSGTSVNALESEIFFGDATTTTDIGALKISSSTGLTTTWSNYNESQNLSLQELYAYNTLRQSKRFKNYLRLSFKYPHLLFSNVFLIKNKYYYPAAYTHDLGFNNISVDLIEVITDQLNGMQFNTTILTTSDGN